MCVCICVLVSPSHRCSNKAPKQNNFVNSHSFAREKRLKKSFPVENRKDRIETDCSRGMVHKKAPQSSFIIIIIVIIIKVITVIIIIITIIKINNNNNKIIAIIIIIIIIIIIRGY